MRVMVIVNNYHGYWEYGVSRNVAWNTGQRLARDVARAMLSYGDMGLGEWNAYHRGSGVWNVPFAREQVNTHLVGDYYPNVWQGALVNMDSRGNNRGLRFKDRTKFVFISDNGIIREATDADCAAEFGGVR